MKYKARFFDSKTLEHKASFQTNSYELLKNFIARNKEIKMDDICEIKTDDKLEELYCCDVCGLPSPEQRARIEELAHQAVEKYLNNEE